MRFLKLKADGTAHYVDVKGDPLYKAMANEIGCEWIEFVKMHGIGKPAEFYAMVCDEEFLLKEEPQVNKLASILYGVHDHGQVICGDVLIVREKHTPDGIESVGLADPDVGLFDAIMGIVGVEVLHET